MRRRILTWTGEMSDVPHPVASSFLFRFLLCLCLGRHWEMEKEGEGEEL